MSTSTTATPLKIGLLLPSPTPIQLLDLSAIDLLYMTTATYVSSCPMLPKPLLSQSHPCTINYISASPSGSLHACTSNLSVRTTASLADAEVAPGMLDLLLVPGPAPGIVPGEEVLGFLRAHFEAGTHVLGICTGVFVCGYAGILDGKWVTGPRALIPMLREKFPGAEKWDESRRVVRDGRVWTCGGITNGLDLVAHYLREHYPPALVNTILAMADVPERSVKYDTGPTRDNMFFLWQVLRILPSAAFRMIGFS